MTGDFLVFFNHTFNPVNFIMILNKFSFGSDCENLVVYEGVAEAIYKIMANIGMKFFCRI